MAKITELVLNVQQEINNLAALKNHVHPQYLENTPSVTYLTNAHAETQATSSQLGHVIVDNEVKNSNNPISNAAIKNYVDAIPIINLDDTVVQDSTNGITSGAVYTAIDDAKKNIDISGLSPTNPAESTLDDFDDAITPGTYQINTNVVMYNKPNVNTTNSILTVLKTGTVLTHILNLPDGSEYRRIGEIQINDIHWNDWRLSYLPFQKYTIPLAGATYNNNVHDIEIFQDTSGYTIRWDQTYNPDGTKQTYFVSHSTQYEYKHVVKFAKNLDIVGPYVFGNVVNAADIKIQPDGIYLRSTKASHNITGINETFFIPRVP